MGDGRNISERWIKASVLGTVWAASEIVLGSFLHNLRIPFSSNLLTAIGIIILISGSYKWRDRGLFWRAGVICALMKTMSPSAVIFGPMVAIFSQAMLLELSTRIFGRNAIGFLTGAIFAMTWNLFHKIMNFIIYYGFSITGIYSDLLKYAQRQLGTEFDLVWSPILILAGIYALLGVITGITAIRVGRRLLSHSPAPPAAFPAPGPQPVQGGGRGNFPYSVAWLLLNIVFIATAFLLMSYAPWPAWSIVTVAIVLAWVTRYKRALRQVTRPRLWIYFVLITMATSFVIVRIQSGDLLAGLENGIRMNFRAAIVIMGFSVLGTELYNPVVRGFFARSAFRQLPMALELSLKSLPVMIASVPDIKTIVRNPVEVIGRVLSQIDRRLEEARMELAGRLFIITGGVGQGKTTQALRLAAELRARGLRVGGLCSERITEGGVTTGYDITDLGSGASMPFLRVGGGGTETIGRYTIVPGSVETGRAILAGTTDGRYDVVIVDEVGKLELAGGGWSDVLPALTEGPAILVLAVRNRFAAAVAERWKTGQHSLFEVNDDLYLRLAAAIEKRVAPPGKGQAEVNASGL